MPTSSKSKYNLTHYGHPLLRKTMTPVEEVTPELVTLTEEMLECMHENRGVGLAANQIGLDMAVAVAHYEGVTLRMFNPRILNRGGDQRYEEGCLSIPGVNGDVSRAQTVTVEYTDVEGKVITESHDGHVARIIQHEVDHLNGLMIVNHLSVATKALHKKTLKALRERTLARLKRARS